MNKLAALLIASALAAGASPEEVRQVGMLAVTTCGFPAAIAGLGWIDQVLKAR